MDRFKLLQKSKINNLPKTTGVYSFSDGKKVIYIGKAINIQNRVKNHFNQPSYRDDLFINKVNKIGFLETNSEIEALILEANLIKKYQPKFNVVWRDDKNYFYVAIVQNKNKIPYIFVTHQKTEKAEYVGPFVEGQTLKKTLRFLRRIFPYYTLAKHSKNKCIYCHLRLCPGPQPDLKEYRKNIKKLILILKGKRNSVSKSLKREMVNFSKQHKFEEAGIIRDKIYNLQRVMAHSNVIQSNENSGILPALNKVLKVNKEIHRIECYDVSNIQGKFATGSMVVFIDGMPDKSQYKKFKIKMNNEPNDIAMLKETLQRRFSHPEWKYPEVILIDGGIAQLNVAIEVKNKTLGRASEQIKIISIAKKNKDLYIENKPGFIPLKNLPREIYNLILRLDDEAHRFAIAYHKKLRRKNLLV